jgi:uncharacterized protein involved in exopolysaccharide biosynthesis
MNSRRPRTLTDFVRATRRRKLIVILSLLVFAIAAGIAVKRLPDIYESSVVVAIEPAGGETARESVSIDQAGRLSALRQQATSRAVIEAIISKHQLFNDEISRRKCAPT